MKDADKRVMEAEALVREAELEKEKEEAKKAAVDGQKGEEEDRVRAARQQAEEEGALRKEAEKKVGAVLLSVSLSTLSSSSLAKVAVLLLLTHTRVKTIFAAEVVC